MDSESVDAVGFFVDEKYEFSAPKFFDLLKEETDEEIKEAEMWFKKGKSDDPSRKHFCSWITHSKYVFFYIILSYQRCFGCSFYDENKRCEICRDR